MACTADMLAKVEDDLKVATAEITAASQTVVALLGSGDGSEYSQRTLNYWIDREKQLRTKEVLLHQQKDSLLKLLAQEAQAREMDYDGGVLTFDSMAFESPPAAPIQMAPADWVRCGLERVGADVVSGVLNLGRDSSFHNLSVHVMTFLCKRKTGSTEDGVHGRHDALLEIIALLSGLVIERNKQTSSSKAGTRLDFWLGQPPVVLGEEKPVGSKLEEAMEEIKDKFVFTPHYEQMRFVIGIAIAGDSVKMGQLWRIRGWEQVTSFNLRNMAGRIGCIRAVLNVGRLCRFILEESLLHAVNLPWNKLHENDRRKLRISYQYVEKVYLQAGAEEGSVERLMEFYNDTREVHYLETAVNMGIKNGNLELRLVPVGLERRPRSAEELKVAMRCVFDAVASCNSLEWALNDLRWPNIIVTGCGHWFIIDCEYVRRFGEPLPDKLRQKCPWTHVCGPSTDLYMLGRLLVDLQDAPIFDDDLRELLHLLASKRATFDVGLTPRNVIDSFPWLGSVSPREQAPSSADM